MKKILIIETTAISSSLSAKLANGRVSSQFSDDGTTGLSHFEKTPPDLLLLDSNAPETFRLDICREVRKDESLNRLRF